MFAPLYLAMLLAFGSPNEEPVPEQRYVVIYDIRDLEHVVPDFVDAPELDLNAALNGQGQSPFRDLQQNQPAARVKDGQEIIDLITSVIEPEAWGVDASIRYFRGTLIVDAPKRIHDQID